jgi:hypothetical protein
MGQIGQPLGGQASQVANPMGLPPQAVQPSGPRALQTMQPNPQVAQQPARTAEMPIATNQNPFVLQPTSLDRSNSPQQAEHPLLPTVRWAEAQLPRVRALQDYSCTFVKRERIGETLGEHQYLYLKVRHDPFSVYVRFLAPSELRDREVIYIEGQNDGKMWAHPNGVQRRVVGTISLSPTGSLAMKGHKYPITEAGILTLVERLLEHGRHDSQYGECEVKFFEHAKINGRDCTCIQVLHPVPRRNFRFHLARIYVDNELQLPLRYEAYNWPTKPGGAPVLTEEYTYLNLALNSGLTDADFDIANPGYGF